MNTLVIGSGRIGTAIGKLLTKSHTVRVVDKLEEVGTEHTEYDVVFACVPYHACVAIADATIKGLARCYVDLTEDVMTRENIREIAKAAPERTFISGSGLAPGYINMLAGRMVRHLGKARKVSMMCGALPVTVGTYKVSWSAEGLCREYKAPVEVKLFGQYTQVPPLSGYIPKIKFPNGPELEAFYTSGGAGTCPRTLNADNVCYRTLRYKGHKTIASGLGSPEDFVNKFGLLGNEPDVVYVIVRVDGENGSDMDHYEKITRRDGLTAIQYATAKGAIDIFEAATKTGKHGFIRPEEL